MVERNGEWYSLDLNTWREFRCEMMKENVEVDTKGTQKEGKRKTLEKTKRERTNNTDSEL